MSPTNPHHEGNPQIKFEEPRKKINPCDLSIVWGEDNRYWKVPNYGQPAELYQLSWLEMTGCVSETVPEKDYEVGFNTSLTSDAFGWSDSRLYILVKRRKTGKFKGHKFPIDTTKDINGRDIKARAMKIDENNVAKEAEQKMIKQRFILVCMKSGVASGREASRLTMLLYKKCEFYPRFYASSKVIIEDDLSTHLESS